MTTAPTPALLPCPFCGGPVAMEEAYPTRSSMYGERRWWGVICRNTINRGGSCAIQQIPSASIDAAAERWNHRAPLDARKPLPLSDAEIIAAQEALALSRSRIGLPCTRCGTGKYRADCNAYHDFHRCNSCMHVPMWDADGNELGATSPLPGITGESS